MTEIVTEIATENGIDMTLTETENETGTWTEIIETERGTETGIGMDMRHLDLVI
jgi:hypothetical protein